MNDPDPDDRLDAMLRDAFAPPPRHTFERAARAAIPAAPAHHIRPRIAAWPWLLTAAALLATLLLAFWPGRRGPEGHDGAQLGALWAAAYEHALATGFAGGTCCEGAVDLASTCRQRFATPLQLAQGGDVALHGTYCGLSTGGCMTLLASAGGDPVCVYVVPRSQDPRVQLPPDSPLCLERRELADLVLYALSRSPAAATLRQFTVPTQ